MSDEKLVTFTTDKGTRLTVREGLARKLGYGSKPEASDEGELKGAALDAALKEAGLPVSGSADEKRARLAEHQSAGDSAEGGSEEGSADTTEE